jgi:predicted phosphodiesterase
MSKKQISKILVLGDFHAPFQLKNAVNKFLLAVKREQPDVVVQIGDLYDNWSTSRYTKNPNYTTPEAEMIQARKDAERLWSTIQRVSPKTKCFQLLGNHDDRIKKRVAEKLPEITHMMDKTIKDLYAFDNVVSMGSERDELEIDDLKFIHGHLSKLGDHSKKAMKSVVCGHSHVGGVVFYKYDDKLLFELNVGFVADETKLPLQYGLSKTKAWTLGYGKLTKINGIWNPQFVPLR